MVKGIDGERKEDQAGSARSFDLCESSGAEVGEKKKLLEGQPRKKLREAAFLGLQAGDGLTPLLKIQSITMGPTTSTRQGYRRGRCSACGSRRASLSVSVCVKLRATLPALRQETDRRRSRGGGTPKEHTTRRLLGPSDQRCAELEGCNAIIGHWVMNSSSARKGGRTGGGEVERLGRECLLEAPRVKQRRRRLANLHINWLTALSRNHTLCQKRAKPAAPTLKAFGNRSSSSSARRIGRFHHPSDPLLVLILILILHLAASSTCPDPLHRHPRSCRRARHRLSQRNATQRNPLEPRTTRQQTLHIPRNPHVPLSTSFDPPRTNLAHHVWRRYAHINPNTIG